MNPTDWMAKLPSPLASATPGEPRHWYRIRAAAQGDSGSTDEVDVFVYGVIGGWWSGVDAATFVRELRDVDAKQLNVHINSVGGSVYDGLAIFQALRNHKARIVTYVDALAASAASLIAMAGDHRVSAPYAETMVHKAWGLCVGNDDDMETARADLARVSRNMATVYANRSTSDATVGEWLDVMKAETWYSAADAVEAGLMHEVQEDAEKTASDGGDDDAQAMNRYALEFFGLTERAAHLAQARGQSPEPPTANDQEPIAPLHVEWKAADGDALLEGLRQVIRAHYSPEASGAEPEQHPTPEPMKEEDPVSTLSENICSRLGLADDADDTAILEAFDRLKAQADKPAEPTPDALAASQAATEATAKAEAAQAEMKAEIARLSGELTEIKAEKAADAKTALFAAAIKDGKIKPADRESWEARYDKAPDVIADILASIAPGTAVPVKAAGEIGDPEPDIDDEFEAMLARIDGPTTGKAA